MQQPEQSLGSGSVNARQQVRRWTNGPPPAPGTISTRSSMPSAPSTVPMLGTVPAGQRVGRAQHAVGDAGGQRAQQGTSPEVHPLVHRVQHRGDVTVQQRRPHLAEQAPLVGHHEHLRQRRRWPADRTAAPPRRSYAGSRSSAVAVCPRSGPARRRRATAAPGGPRPSRARPAARASTCTTSRRARRPRAATPRQRRAAASRSRGSSDPPASDRGGHPTRLVVHEQAAVQTRQLVGAEHGSQRRGDRRERGAASRGTRWPRSCRPSRRAFVRHVTSAFPAGASDAPSLAI